MPIYVQVKCAVLVQMYHQYTDCTAVQYVCPCGCTAVLIVQLYSTFAPAADSTKSGQLSDGVTRASLLRQLGSGTAHRTYNTVR